MLFKYRKLDTVEDITRFIDIINNLRLFFPKYDQLNDPLEGSGYVFPDLRYAGSWAAISEDKDDSIIIGKKQEYRVLSLSEDCFSPQSWAHYCSVYSGACIGFWRNNSLKKAKKIDYINNRIEVAYDNSSENIEELYFHIEKSFFYKHKGWEYEKEWRIIEKTDNSYFEFLQNDIACIIFGDKIEKSVRELIVNNIHFEIPMYRSYPGARTFRINLVDIDYEHQYDGRNVKTIHTISELKEDIINRQDLG